MKILLSFTTLLLTTLLYAESLEEAFEGFDETEKAAKSTSSMVSTTSSSVTVAQVAVAMEGFDDAPSTPDTLSETLKEAEIEEEGSNLLPGLTGKLTQQIALSYNSKKPNPSIFSSLRNSLFLDYEHKFENSIKIKVNARAFYDGMYDVRESIYYPQEIDELHTEVELFESYVEWNIIENLDMKLGRQVVVWGGSDNIRITDILNPLDNRRPGTIDIKDIRLPTTMAKFNYSLENWNITPIFILEQRFSKNPPIGSIYNPLTNKYKYYDQVPKPIAAYTDQFNFEEENYTDVTYALNVAGEFEGWDINFYAAHVYNDEWYLSKVETINSVDDILKVKNKKIKHAKVDMAGLSLNLVSGSWLFRTEFAYFDGMKYLGREEEYSRLDSLIGFDYSGINNTSFSYEYAQRHINDFQSFGQDSEFEQKNTYQHALRVRSNFLDDTLHVNYIVTLFGGDADEGGYQRTWLEYDLDDSVKADIGFIDYLGGSLLADQVKDEVIIFTDISYSF